ncbi:MAG: glycosyltransferase family 2 protein [Thermoanaerobaculia bacterium]
MALAEVPAAARAPFLSIVIPLFNEVDNLQPLIAEMEAALPARAGPVEVIVVDDGSRDGSWPLLRTLTSTRPWLKAIRFLTNRGQTAAMAAGIAAASGDVIAFLDADLQNDPNDIPKLLAPILGGSADVVCGWRANRRDPALTRTLPSVLANFLIRKSLHFAVHDVGCTLKAFRRAYIQDVALFGEMHRFLPSYAKSQGARIDEVVVSHRPRHAGKSKYGFERVWKVLIDLLTVKMLNEYGASPAYLFGKVALIFFLLGTAALGVVSWRVLVEHHYEATPMVFAMTLLFITGLLTLMVGLLAEINIRVLHQVGGQRGYQIVERVGFPSGGEE